MPTPIRFIEKPILHTLNPENKSVYYDGTVDFAKLVVGDMCFYHYQGKPITIAEKIVMDKLHLTQHYFKNNAARSPLILAMPDRASKSPRYFLVDGQCYSNKCTACGKPTWKCGKVCKISNPRGYYDGWTVSGVPPKITIAPSVDFDDEDVKHYHGFVQNGIIGDG